MIFFTTVRLVDSHGHVDDGHSGANIELRVEIFILGMWRTTYVAENTWNRGVANLICRAAGYDSALRPSTMEYPSYETHPFKLQTIECPEDAESIFECFYDWHKGAETLKAASVICENGQLFYSFNCGHLLREIVNVAIG